MPGRPQVFTVGHGARSWDAFVAVVRSARIEVVVDVRRFPGSRRHPQFGRAAMADSLPAAGIGYEWHGDPLGGRRSRSGTSRHRALHHAAFAGYADHMDTAGFRTALDALLSRAPRERLAVMCAETVWWHCHRMLIADALVLRGAAVTHLLDVGRVQPHRLHPAARKGEGGWPVYDVSDALSGP